MQPHCFATPKTAPKQNQVFLSLQPRKLPWFHWCLDQFLILTKKKKWDWYIFSEKRYERISKVMPESYIYIRGFWTRSLPFTVNGHITAVYGYSLPLVNTVKYRTIFMVTVIYGHHGNRKHIIVTVIVIYGNLSRTNCTVFYGEENNRKPRLYVQ